MKPKSLLFIAFLFVVSGISVSAQKIKLIEGSLDALRGATALNAKYDYSSISVGKFDREADYVAKKKAEYNQKEPGKGDKWADSWEADRSGRFEPQFEELFQKYSDINLGGASSAKYTLILKTTFIEPGFNVYITRKNALIDAEVLIVESANPGKVLAKISIAKAPGRTYGGYDFDTGQRIQEAYAAAGKALGKFIKDAR